MTEQVGLVRFVGKTYVVPQVSDTPAFCVCIDSEQQNGIVLMYFAPEDKMNAYAASSALNTWAGFDVEKEILGPQLIRN